MPQTQSWCAGDFAVWDNRITTFPGLYVLGVVWVRVLRCGSWQLAALPGVTPLDTVSDVPAPGLLMC